MGWPLRSESRKWRFEKLRYLSETGRLVGGVRSVAGIGAHEHSRHTDRSLGPSVEDDFASTEVSGTIAGMELGFGTVVRGDDGWMVAYLDAGDPDGYPIIGLHGTPG